LRVTREEGSFGPSDLLLRPMKFLVAGHTSRGAKLFWIIHLVPLSLTVTYLGILATRSQWSNLSRIAVLFTSTWLVVAPILLPSWGRLFTRLEGGLSECVDRGDLFSSRTRKKLSLIQWALVAVPPALMTVAFQTGDLFLGEELGIPLHGWIFWVGQGVLLIGGVSAGFGLALAAVTLHLGKNLAVAPSTFNPFAGVTLEVSHHLAEFCFRSAMLFGIGGSVLVPGVVAAISKTEGGSRLALCAVIVLLVSFTIAMLAVPAVYVSSRFSSERNGYLASLSVEIESLAQRATWMKQGFSNDDYVRIRALLELRSHVVERSIPPAAVEMARRIPLAVVLPVLSVAASWASALAS
jgi:hypothetical protein